ncbi:MAG: restriction endonuclease [Desulfotomaculaceae bacterium]|nr:restriction endonuclease [Desulfotomaculaceae bacterium]
MAYTIKEPKEDTRSFLGRQVDRVGTLLLVWLITFLLIANLTENLTTALMFSIPLLVAEVLVLRKFWQIRLQKRQNRRRYWLAGQKIIRNLKNMHPESEFKPYVREIIASLPGFQNVVLNPVDGEGSEEVKKWGIDLTGDYHGTPVAIQCKYPEGDKEITSADIRAFAGSLKLEGFKNGLLVTCGEFGPGAARVAVELSQKGINLKLINRFRLIELARRAGRDGVSSEQARHEVTSDAGGNRARIITALKDTIFTNRTKAKSYFLYGLLLYGGYILMRGTSKLSLIYLAFAGLNLLLGACCLYLGRSIDDKDPLAGLGSDN